LYNQLQWIKRFSDHSQSTRAGGDVFWKVSQTYVLLRQGDSTAHVRMDAAKKETIDQYFSLLHDKLEYS